MKQIDSLAFDYGIACPCISGECDCTEAFKAGFRKARELFLEKFGHIEAGNRWQEMAEFGEQETS